MDLRPPAWSADALCKEYPELEFVLIPRGAPVEPLKAVCRRCAVREECLQYALADEDLEGVWGGTSTRERREYRRARPRSDFPFQRVCCRAPTSWRYRNCVNGCRGHHANHPKRVCDCSRAL